MCYSVFLATDADDDLSRHDADGVSFLPAAPEQPGQHLLQPPQHWTVNAGTCGCGFRHLHTDSVDLGFSEPVEWFPESDDAIAATRHVIGVIRSLASAGARVECLDLWNGEINGEVPIVIVNLDEVVDPTFRFFEHHRFVFMLTP
jgi:hypothetical protein